MAGGGPLVSRSGRCNIQVLAGQNAALHVRGNVAVVPVELMEFDVEWLDVPSPETPRARPVRPGW